MVGLLDTTEEGSIDVSTIIVVAISVRDHTRVDTLGKVRRHSPLRDYNLLTVELQCQISTNACGMGSQVTESTSWMSRNKGTPVWSSTTFSRISSPVTSIQRYQLIGISLPLLMNSQYGP